jgi:hypothetical protein
MSDETSSGGSEEFGRQLFSWAQGGDAFLVVITTKAIWSGRWTADARSFTLSLESPDARQLVRQELKIKGLNSRIAILEDASFTQIWNSSPKAEDARRLADIIAQSADLDISNILGEYGDWRSWIDEALPGELSIRTLFWSSAFCDGGRRVSVLNMSDALRRELNELRTPATILAEGVASKRLSAAKIERAGKRVWLAPDRHGLPSAVCRHLWDEFETERKTLATWALGQISTLPADDAERVARSLLDLALYYNETSLLRRIRDSLTGASQSLAVQVFSDVVLDPRFGAHVRGCLYRWLAPSPSQEVIDLVAEICGGRFGTEKPDMALVRLQRAAMKSKPDSKILADSFTSLAMAHSGKVFKAITEWFKEPSTRRSAVVAFLGLASTDVGIRLICGERGRFLANPVFQKPFALYFKAAIADSDTRDAAESVMKAWSALVDQGSLPKDQIVAVFGMSLAPWIEDNVMRGFFTDSNEFDVHSFWGRVFLTAARDGKEKFTPAS